MNNARPKGKWVVEKTECFPCAWVTYWVPLVGQPMPRGNGKFFRTREEAEAEAARMQAHYDYSPLWDD